MLNPDLHLTLYISEEIIKIVCASIVCTVAIWGVVKMTDILFNRRKEKNETS